MYSLLDILVPSCFKVFPLSSMFSYWCIHTHDGVCVCCYECVTIPVTLWSVVPSLLRVCGCSSSNLWAFSLSETWLVEGLVRLNVKVVWTRNFFLECRHSRQCLKIMIDLHTKEVESFNIKYISLPVHCVCACMYMYIRTKFKHIYTWEWVLW